MPPDFATLPTARMDAASRLDRRLVAALDDPAATPGQRLKACRFLVRFGRIGEAVTVLAELGEDPRLRRQVAAIMEQIRTVRRLGLDAEIALPGAARGDASDDGRGYWVVPADSDTTLIAFTGKAQRLGMSIYFMQGILRRLGMNVIYLFDWRDCFYYAGVGGLGATLVETVAGLRATCAALGSRKLLCLGQSTGGHAAIRYGAELSADGVLAFSPLVSQVMQPRALARIADVTGVPATPDTVDLRTVLAGEPRRVLLVYGADNGKDVRSAEHLAGVPGVIARPLAGVSQHMTLEVTTLAGGFEDLVRDFSAGLGPGAWSPDRCRPSVPVRRRLTARPVSRSAVGLPRLWP